MMGWIYFIQAGEEGPIKIGWATEPKQRLATFQTANPHTLHLRGTVPGSQQDEANFHAFFQHHRIRGEWFQPCQCIFNFICQETVLEREVDWGVPTGYADLDAPHNSLEIAAFQNALIAPVGWGAGVRAPWRHDSSLEECSSEEVERFNATLRRS